MANANELCRWDSVRLKSERKTLSDAGHEDDIMQSRDQNMILFTCLRVVTRIRHNRVVGRIFELN